MKTLIKAFLILNLVIMGVACSKKSSDNKPQTEGTSSGGGSFGDESSMQLLNWTKEIVAASFRNANPEIFNGLPKEWTPERMAKIIENTRPEPRVEVARYNRELMFDYRIPKNGEPYLVATALFFRAHASVPIEALFGEDLEPYLRQIRNKLLHELAHLMGIGMSEQTDFKASAFSTYLVISLFAKNNVVCRAAEVPADYLGRIDDSIVENESKLYDCGKVDADANYYYWIFNRATGFGMQAAKSACLNYTTWLSALLKGQTRYSSSFTRWPFVMKNPGLIKMEPKRYYTSASSLVYDSREVQQYFKARQSNESGQIIFSGVDEFTESVNNANDTSKNEIANCEYRESIDIPRAKSGHYKARLTYSYICKRPSDGSLTTDLHNKTELDCVESFEKFSNMNQFMDGNELSDPELIQWQKNRGKLD